MWDLQRDSPPWLLMKGGTGFYFLFFFFNLSSERVKENCILGLLILLILVFHLLEFLQLIY